MTSKGREIAAFTIWVPVALAFTLLYMNFITRVLGHRLGLEGGAYVVMLPLGLLFFAAVIWMPFFVWRRRKLGARLGLIGGVMGAALAGIVLFPACATSCFDGRGSDAYLGEAAMLFAFLGAFAHDALSRAYLESGP